MPTLYYWLLTQNMNATLAAVIAVAVPCAAVIGAILFVAGFSTYLERKIAADIQRRIGPNKCNIGSFFGAWARIVIANGQKPNAGFNGKMMGLTFALLLPLFDIGDKVVTKLAPGFVIFMADGMKLILKEDIIPDAVDKPLFRMAPVIVLVSALGALAALPFSDAWYIADFNIGLFFIAAITSIEVLGILMAGWASNNKWALLGGMRSVAQIVSYELPVGLVIATAAVLSGTLSMQNMIYDQFGFAGNAQGWFWQWNLFHPAMFVLAPVYFLAALAECNRTPFDIPEAESELVSGYHTEYSGMRFGLFFMAEYTMMFVTSAIAVTIFLGGWSTGIGFIESALVADKAVFAPNGVMTQAPVFAWYGTLLHLIVFVAKTYALVVVMMWIRWTLPRFRVDQMMTLCWKKLIPIGLFCFLAVSAWMLLRMPVEQRWGRENLDWTLFVLRAVFALSVLGGLGWFFSRKGSAAPLAKSPSSAQA